MKTACLSHAHIAPCSRFAAVIAAALLMVLPAGPARAQSPADGATTPSSGWQKFDWGELGVLQLQAAPFPDDSRTTGYSRRGKEYPREGHYDDGSVAFCVPANYRKDDTVDVVVTLHGHVSTCERFATQSHAGEWLSRSGRNAIFMVPQGPKMVPDSGAGKLEKPGGFAAMMDEALEALRASGRVAPGARLGNVVLCGFSGGGRGVGLILRNGDLADHVSEVWLFDAAYEQLDGLTKLAAQPAVKASLRSIFTEHLTDDNLEMMHLITQGQGPVAVFNDPTTTETLAKASLGAATGLPADHALLKATLRQRPVLFIHTQLPHDLKALSDRYMLAFLEEARSLSSR